MASAPVVAPVSGSEALDPQRTVEWLAAAVATELGAPADAVDVHAPVFDLGLQSAQIAALTTRLSDRVGHELDATFFLRYSTIAAIAAAVADEAPLATAGLAGKGAPPTRRDAAAPGAEAQILVCGIGCRFPGARGVDAFWDALLRGYDAVGRWEPSRGGMALAGEAGFVDSVECFDASFFRIAPAEAAEMDPQQRLVLEVAWEALEDAGLRAATLRERIVGVFIGASHSEFALERFRHAAPASAVATTGSALSVVANRLSYCLDLRGPSMTVDTACSSSLVAFHLACRSLRDGECDIALVGGVNLLLSPEVTSGLRSAGMLSPSSRCRSFDADADGYVRGEGAGIVVLQRAETTACADRAYAVVLSTGCNQDGRSSALTAPNPRAQEALIERVLDRAGIPAGDVAFVEAHGSATPLGDPVEVNAIRNAYGRGAGAADCLWVGSVKSNVGHLEAASGIAGVIKAVLAIHHGMLPRSLHVQKANPLVAWDKANIHVARENTPLASRGKRIVGAVSSFGFGGTNAHALLADGRGENARAPAAQSPSVGHWILLSAASPAQLRAHVAVWVDWLKHSEPPPLSDLSYTTLLRRDRLPVRAAFRATEHAELLALMEALLVVPPVALHKAPDEPTFGLFVDACDPRSAEFDWSALPAGDFLWRSAFDRVAESVRDRSGLDLANAFAQARAGGPVSDEAAQALGFAVCLATGEMLYASGFRPSQVWGRGSGVLCARYLAREQSLETAIDAALVCAEESISRTGPEAAAVKPPTMHLWVGLSARALDLPAFDGRPPVAAFNTGAREGHDAYARIVSALAAFGFEPPVDPLVRRHGRVASLPPYPWNRTRFPLFAAPIPARAVHGGAVDGVRAPEDPVAVAVPLSGLLAVRALPAALWPAGQEPPMSDSVQRGLKRRQRLQPELSRKHP